MEYNPEGPTYYFKSGEPIVKKGANFSEIDIEIIKKKINAPIDNRYIKFKSENDILKNIIHFDTSRLSKYDPYFGLNHLYDDVHRNLSLSEYTKMLFNSYSNYFSPEKFPKIRENLKKYFMKFSTIDELKSLFDRCPTLDIYKFFCMWRKFETNRYFERISNDPFISAGLMSWLILENYEQIATVDDPIIEHNIIFNISKRYEKMRSLKAQNEAENNENSFTLYILKWFILQLQMQ